MVGLRLDEPFRWGVPTTKAVTGGFASVYESGVPLRGLYRSPQKVMAEAQALYWNNPWIRLAEATVTRKVSNLPWHFEDAEDEEWAEDSAPPVVLQAMKLFETVMIGNRRVSRRALIGLTSRHTGLCGMSTWFLDRPEVAAGTPAQILYINPARMTAMSDDSGNLEGWSLDAQDEYGRGGVPLPADQVLPFYLEEPDSGHYGTGLVVAAWLKAQITTLESRHEASVLGTGGRIAGIISPKNATLEPGTFKELEQDFRNANEAPDAARRTTIMRGPVDFQRTAADPNELGLTEIARMNREDILSVWGVPSSQASIAGTSTGLNAGETRKYDEAVLMQGSVHDRVNALKEPIQNELLNRYVNLGFVIELEVEEPEYDDRTPAFALAAAAREQPLKNSERREIMGYPPFGDPVLDNAIILPALMADYAQAPPAKARVDTRPEAIRSAIEKAITPRIRASMASALRAQAAEIAGKVRSGANIKRAGWWPGTENERLHKALAPHLTAIAEEVTKRLGAQLEPKAAKAEGWEERIMSLVLQEAGKRITEINATTRQAVKTFLEQGIEAGQTAQELAGKLVDLPAFDAARADLVARTETMFAYNASALGSYGEFGVQRVQAIDGDQDEECAARNGQTYTVDEAFAIQDHPNGTLDWMPVLGKASLGNGWNGGNGGTGVTLNMAPITVNVPPQEVTYQTNVAVPDQPAPTVNVSVPSAIPAPVVVNVPKAEPVINVEAGKATVGDVVDVRIVEDVAPTKPKRVVRDANGRIAGVEDGKPRKPYGD